MQTFRVTALLTKNSLQGLFAGRARFAVLDRHARLTPIAPRCGLVTGTKFLILAIPAFAALDRRARLTRSARRCGLVT